MLSTKLSRTEIENLLPHREPMLLIDELINIKKLNSATAIMTVKKINITYMVLIRKHMKIN